jgi:hypothetical protein
METLYTRKDATSIGATYRKMRDNELEEIQKNQVMIYLNGSKTAFRCECGCNVFMRVVVNETRTDYECNGCRITYRESDK